MHRHDDRITLSPADRRASPVERLADGARVAMLDTASTAPGAASAPRIGTFGALRQPVRTCATTASSGRVGEVDRNGSTTKRLPPGLVAVATRRAIRPVSVLLFRLDARGSIAGGTSRLATYNPP